MISLTMDGIKVEAAAGENLLGIAQRNGLEIPHLCYHPGVSVYGGCRLCLVEVMKGEKGMFTTSCTYPATEGLVVRTNTPQLKKARRLLLEMLLPLAPQAKVLQELAKDFELDYSRFVQEANHADDCIRCGLCVRVCEEYVGARAITFAGRGSARVIEPPFAEEAQDCIGCGACVAICPTDCIKMVDKNGERRIIRWNRTMQLQSCSSCGRYFMTRPQIDFIRKNTPDPPAPAWFERCENCR